MRSFLEAIHLEGDFQPKLGLPRRTCIEHASKVRRERDAAGRSDKVQKVEKVEDLCAKLESDSFFDFEWFRQRHIDIPFAVFINNIAAGISESERSRHPERTGIEPAFGRAPVRQVRIPKQVWTLRRARADIAVIA